MSTTTHHLTAERLTAALDEVGQLIASCDSTLAAVEAFNAIRPRVSGSSGLSEQKR